MRKSIKIMFLATLLSGFSSSLIAKDYTVEVSFPGIEKDRIILPGGREYRVTDNTRVFTEHGNPVSYKSVYGVGHIDRAKVTLSNDEVKAIHIIEIQM